MNTEVLFSQTYIINAKVFECVCTYVSFHAQTAGPSSIKFATLKLWINTWSSFVYLTLSNKGNGFASITDILTGEVRAPASK